VSYVLRGYFRSSASWRVRIALHWKGLPFETVPVHLLRGGGEQHGEAHRTLNPMEQLPVLLVGGVPYSQSLAILELLEELHPTPALLPRESHLRAKARQLAEVVNSGIQPVQNLFVMQELGRRFGADREAQVAWSRSFIERGLVALEALVAPVSGHYAVGDSVSFADLCLVPQLYNARRFAVDLSACPTLVAIDARLAELPAFQAASPERQPDYEP
jgi:maleylpyruvate isomerase